MHKLTPPFRTPPPPAADDQQGEAITVEQALDHASRATELATDLAGALEEARALLIQVMAIEPHELEPPILKEQGDLAQARKMSRKLLEEKYVLARMATRLSMRKVHDLEGEVERLEYKLTSQAKREQDNAAATAKYSARVEEIARAHEAGIKKGAMTATDKDRQLAVMSRAIQKAVKEPQP